MEDTQIRNALSWRLAAVRVFREYTIQGICHCIAYYVFEALLMASWPIMIRKVIMPSLARGQCVGEPMDA